MKRQSIFGQIEHSVRFQRKMEERHGKHIANGKRRPNTCFLCRIEILRERQAASPESKA